ncbi:hypothetical protein F5Y00DRAFT_234673 [Daldinia vernicosa]|uniref:uncharacterized protein n=1 Tax=Daldinia vernicosa TaxID=114800 RepID=UPI002007B8D7|nr:uncharacterized protein F5Y00DRAFT_234673 [Daldinia vernicosa]KAI0849741.1 hypothetical protein F5Y00DRAFT_234673 [Daldinia vernicosa]
MQLPRSLGISTAVLLCQIRVALSYDTTPFIGPLDPWRVTRLQITAPEPGHSRPFGIDLAISNPNKVSAGPAPHAAGGGYLPFAPSAANCTVESADGDTAVSNTCIETTQYSYGVWSVDLLPGNTTIDPRSFNLVFTLNYNVTRWGGILYKLYEGMGHFGVGDNLEEGRCDDGSGTCLFTLKVNSTPALIPPTMTACQGTCRLD